MGGTIQVESEEGKGSLFSMTIPFKTAEQQEEPEAREKPEPGSHKAEHDQRILVVEDHPINQHLMQAILKRLGFQVEIAENGEIALGLLEKRSYDLIFMDIQMPVMDGYEATRRIRSRYPEEDCPVIIAMTANALQGDKERSLALGMNAYITKPIRSDIVEAELKKWIGAGKSAKSKP
jgi:CheY-like chemotaxis protein